MKYIRNSLWGPRTLGVVMMGVEWSVGLQPACMTSPGKAVPCHIHEQDRPMLPPTQVPFWSCLCMQGVCPSFLLSPFWEKQYWPFRVTIQSDEDCGPLTLWLQDSGQRGCHRVGTGQIAGCPSVLTPSGLVDSPQGTVPL